MPGFNTVKHRVTAKLAKANTEIATRINNLKKKIKNYDDDELSRGKKSTEY